MSPIDDQLRESLHQRADRVNPPSEVFAGVEQRARRMRRNRIGASVAGAALAVTAVAFALPALLPDRASHRGTLVATPSDSAIPSPTASYDLDPGRPWAYRGDTALLGNGNLDTFRRDWAAKHPGSQLQPLFGHVSEASKQPELVFVARVGADARWGVVTTSESGSHFVVDQPLPASVRTLAAVLPADGVARLLVVASPAVTAVRYAPDGVTFRSMTTLAPGVAVTPLDGDQSRDEIATFGTGGQAVDQVAAPAAAASVQPTPSVAGVPGNVLTWPTRGTVAIAALHNAESAYAGSRQQPVTKVVTKVLYAGTDAAGTNYLLTQMWVTGDKLADTVGFVQHPDGTNELQLKSRVTQAAGALAIVVVDAPARATETLVVVPRPTFGQLLYAADGTTFKPQSSDQEGVVVLQRDPLATTVVPDRIRLLDGDGKTFFDDAAAKLLCGVTSCG